jgi:predicted nucleic acid-binding OB-fold protein
MASPELLTYQFEDWFRKIAARRIEYQASEPERLLAVKEYRAAIIAAVSLLEVELVRYFESKRPIEFRLQTMRALAESAERVGLITLDERRRLDAIMRLRNEAVHRNVPVTRQAASEAVRFIKSIVDRLHGEPGIQTFREPL